MHHKKLILFSIIAGLFTLISLLHFYGVSILSSSGMQTAQSVITPDKSNSTLPIANKKKASEQNTSPTSKSPTDWTISSDSLDPPKLIKDFPWHKNIKATYFEGGTKASKNDAGITNTSSAWILYWTVALGGKDTYSSIKDRNPNNPYNPVNFDLKRNPFYAALPADPFTKEAESYFSYWGDNTKNSLGNFVGRWIEITRENNGKSYKCYAQWEDVGPGATDKDFRQYSYVFDSAIVKNTYNGVGIDVSPACAITIGLTPEEGTVNVDWRFVSDPPKGPWSVIVNK